MLNTSFVAVFPRTAKVKHKSGYEKNRTQNKYTLICKNFWNILLHGLFLHPIKGLAYCVMVAQQILVLYVLVRIQVGQQKSRKFFPAFLFTCYALIHSLFLHLIILNNTNIAVTGKSFHGNLVASQSVYLL